MTCKKAEARQGKIYVGKLPLGDALSKEDIQTHFGQFGEVKILLIAVFLFSFDLYISTLSNFFLSFRMILFQNKLTN